MAKVFWVKRLPQFRFKQSHKPNNRYFVEVLWTDRGLHSGHKWQNYTILIFYHFQSRNKTGYNSDYEVEGRLQPLVLLVKQLLVHNAQKGQGPDGPVQVVGKSVWGQCAKAQPGRVGASNEKVDHSPVTSMEELVKFPEKNLQIKSGWC